MALPKEDVLGIDIGAGEVKIALVRTFEHGDTGVVHYDSEPLPPGAISDGRLEDEQALVTALKELRSRHDWGTDTVNFSYVDPETESKVLDLAAGEDESGIELRLTVQNAKDDEFRHLADSDYVFDFVELSRGARRVSVRLVGQKASRINPYAKALRRAGFKPLACEPASLAGARSTLIRRSRSGTRAVVDFGAEQTVFTCRQGAEVIYTRFIDIGSNRINEQIMEQLDCSWEEAEQLKTAIGFELPDASDPSVTSQLSLYLDAVTNVFDALVGRLEAVQRDAEKEFGEIQGITLLGGGSRLKGLHAKLKHYLVVPIEELQSMPGFEMANDFDLFSTALGLSAGPEMTLLPLAKNAVTVKGPKLTSKLDAKSNQRLAGQFMAKRPMANPLLIGVMIGLILIAIMYYWAKADTNKANSLVTPSAPVTTTQTATGYANGDAVTNQVWSLLQQKQAFSFVNALNQMVLGVDNWKLQISPGAVSFSGEVKDKTAFDLMLTRQVDGFARGSTQGGTVAKDGEVPFTMSFTPVQPSTTSTGASSG